jgi:hypothetical protein
MFFMTWQIFGLSVLRHCQVDSDQGFETKGRLLLQASRSKSQSPAVAVTALAVSVGITVTVTAATERRCNISSSAS